MEKQRESGHSQEILCEKDLVCSDTTCRSQRICSISRCPCTMSSVRPEKRAQRLPFWVRRPPGGVGVFRAKGWWPQSSCPPSKVCLPWVLKRGIWDVPGILPGCPGNFAGMSRTPEGVQNVCAKKARAHFSFPTSLLRTKSKVWKRGRRLTGPQSPGRMVLQDCVPLLLKEHLVQKRGLNLQHAWVLLALTEFRVGA